MTGTRLSASDRERLAIERDHLLASLDDLDSELDAGDIDAADYRTLRDDYTARAASLTRALEGGAVSRQRSSRRSTLRLGLTVAGVVLVAVVAALAMAQFSGARGAGETASGEIRRSSVGLLSEAAAAFAAGDVDGAVARYDEVLELQPTSVEALTYRGWVAYQTGDVDSARADFDEAVEYDSEYPDVRVFRAVLALDEEDFPGARRELDAFDRSDPTPVARQLVAQRQLRERTAVGLVMAALEASEVPDLESAGLSIDEAQLAGETLVQLARPGDALLTFDAILAESPDNAPALAWRGWTLALTAESGATELFPDAERWLDEAVAADPTYPAARVFRAFLYRRLDRRDEARAELAAFDQLDVQPSRLLDLIEDFDLRGDLGADQ